MGWDEGSDESYRRMKRGKTEIKKCILEERWEGKRGKGVDMEEGREQERIRETERSKITKGKIM